jgi:hypothetical protein
MTSTTPVVTASPIVTGFSPEQTRRWDAWQQANAVSARRSDRICRAVAAVLFLALLIAVAVAGSRL